MADFNRQEMYAQLGISKEVYEYGEAIEQDLKGRFARIDEIAEYNQLKVVKAMQEAKVQEACLLGTTGYGYNDIGRDTLEEVYAHIFHTEDALVRPQITCGTHALALALMSNLRPGDELLSPVGKPYDTLEEVIGIRPSKGSLAEYGVTYKQVDLLSDGGFDYDGIRASINDKTKLALIGQFDQVLCLDLLAKAAAARNSQAASEQAAQGEDDPEISRLIEARQQARKEKNWAEADRIRDELAAMGITIIDTKDGVRWTRG
jgi:hypothetical protein